MSEVSSNREIQFAQAVLVTGCIDPCTVRILAVCAYCQYFSIQLSKLIVSVAHCCDFCRAYKSKVQRVEEHYQPFAFVVGQLYSTKILAVTQSCFHFKIWSR